MAVAIRLARGGAKKKPYYRLVVTDKRRAVTGKFIEAVGRYGPMADESERFVCDKQRVEYWLKVGAKASRRAQILLAKQGLMEKPPIPKQTKKQLPKKGTLEKIKAKQKPAEQKAEEKAEPPTETATETKQKTEEKPSESPKATEKAEPPTEKAEPPTETATETKQETEEKPPESPKATEKVEPPTETKQETEEKSPESPKSTASENVSENPPPQSPQKS